MVWMGGFAGAMAGGAIPQLTANVPIPVIPAIALFSAFSAFPPATLLLAGFGLGFVILRRHVSPKVLFLFSSLGSAVMVMAPYLIAKWPPINLSANQIFAWSPFLGGVRYRLRGFQE
jgi:hypothetical protein